MVRQFSIHPYLECSVGLAIRRRDVHTGNKLCGDRTIKRRCQVLGFGKARDRGGYVWMRIGL